MLNTSYLSGLSEAHERLRQERYAKDARMKDPMYGTGTEFSEDHEPLFDHSARREKNSKFAEEWRKNINKWDSLRIRNLRNLRQEMQDDARESKKDIEKSLRAAFKSGGHYDIERGVTNPQVPYNVPDKSVIFLCVFFLVLGSANYYLEYHYVPKTNPYLLKLQEERKKLEKSQQ